METHDWLCGCGHWNGPNLANCGGCTRPAQESEVHPKSDPDEPVDSDEVIPGSLDWWDRVHHPAPCNCEALKAALRWALKKNEASLFCDHSEPSEVHQRDLDGRYIGSYDGPWERCEECDDCKQWDAACRLAGLDPETLEAVDSEREE